MKLADITEGKSENRELWDKIRSKGVVPSIDKEKYQARDGLEGPFRLRNGKVVYYDPQEGKYYDPDTDMYIEYDDYKKMDEQGVAEGLEIKIPTEDGITWQDIRLMAGEGKLTKKTVLQALAVIRKQRKERGVAEGDKRPDYVVKASDKPKKVKPSMGGESPHPYQGKLVGATEAEVSNTDYEFTHGKKPKGQGSWFFVAHRGGINFSKDVEGEDYIQLNQMSYGDAKKAAVKWARSKGHTSLFVAT